MLVKKEPEHIPDLFAGNRENGPAIGRPIRGADDLVPRRGSLSVATGFNPWKKGMCPIVGNDPERVDHDNATLVDRFRVHNHHYCEPFPWVETPRPAGLFKVCPFRAEILRLSA
ncbi:MAG: hypothetical protein V1792_26080 [Pseudomonadota bacterium]